MKIKLKYFLILFIINVFHLFAADTTVVTDINYNRNEEAIKFKSDESGAYILTVNDKSVNGQFIEGYDSFIRIIDIDNNDNLKEIAAGGYGSSDYIEWFLYQFVNGKIIACGHLSGNFGIITTGNKILTEKVWMGFYELKFEYKFDSINKTLTYIQKDIYNIDVPAEVNAAFPILRYRYDNSPAAATLKPKTKITLVKVDISPKCSDYETDYKFDDNCDWFLIKTGDGTNGWCRLKDFRDNVDGLIWAG